MQNPLITLRKEAGYGTRNEFTHQLNLSYESVSRYEQGLRPKMTSYIATAMSKVLKVKPEKLKREYLTWRKSLKVA